MQYESISALVGGSFSAPSGSSPELPAGRMAGALKSSALIKGAEEVSRRWVDANGVERYRSCKRRRPRLETGKVLYTGIEEKLGMCLQAWAYAPMCESVG